MLHFTNLCKVSGFSTANEWLMIEEGSAILGACVPTFRPVLKAYFKLPKPINDWLSSAPNALASASKSSSSHLRSHNQPSQSSRDRQGTSFQLKKLSTAYVQRGKERRVLGLERGLCEDLEDGPLVDNRIWVKREVFTSR